MNSTNTLLKLIEDFKEHNSVVENKKKGEKIMKTNFLGFLSKIKEFNNTIVVVEKEFNWDYYYNNPNTSSVPVYHKNEYALNKHEIKEISKDGFVVWLPSREPVCLGLIPFHKFIGYVDDYRNGDLISLFDFKNESLFEKIWVSKD